MTTIIHKDGKDGFPLFSIYGSYSQISAYARKLTSRWQEWQAARELESMPFDVRKDLGWPSTDIANERKAMQ